jgi:hypothetical protein
MPWISAASTACLLHFLYVTDLVVECLATWKDGSETFIYGRLNGAHLNDKEERYRCFVSTDINLQTVDESRDIACSLPLYKQSSMFSLFRRILRFQM